MNISPQQTVHPSTDPRHTAPLPGSTADADQMAVASFVLGLIGLLIFNVVLGPLALGLAAFALFRRTRRRGRALLGLALGAADLAVLAVTLAAGHGTLWQFGA